MGHDLVGRTLGIIGLGHVGTRVAELCRGLFRMRVLAFDPYLDSAAMAAHGVEKAGLDELLGASHYVSVNCPLTAETRGLLGGAGVRADAAGGVLHQHGARLHP